MLNEIVDKWVAGAAVLTALCAIPLAVLSILYSMVLLVVFSLSLIPVGGIYISQYIFFKLKENWYGTRS